MLDFYKRAHEQKASIIPNWHKMNKNDLINKYLEVEDDPVLADAYMSAIIVRYWSAISKYHYLSYKSVKDITTYYDWLVLAIMWAVKHRKWKDPTNKLYGDPNGPDKVVNRVIKSERLIWFQAANIPKRRGEITLESIEKLQNDLGDLAPIPVYDDDPVNSGTSDISAIVDRAFKNKEYIMAFVINGIINYNVFNKVKDESGKTYLEFSKKKLMRYVNRLDDDDCALFASYFHMPLNTVQNARDECFQMSRNRLKIAVDKSIKKLQKIYTED